MSRGDKVNLMAGVTPADYHCTCDFCKKAIGELRPLGGGYYNRLERREYYHPMETGGGRHIAKTPLHIARWAIQTYTKPNDWVLDPTIGAGTTAVEAVTQGRNVAGMELQYSEVLRANIEKNLGTNVEATTRIGDARAIGNFLETMGHIKFSLVVNNPPYSGDESDGGTGKDHPLKGAYRYESGLPNLAFLKESEEYWNTITSIYRQCVAHLKPGGHFVVGVKDMMRNKQPFMLHQQFCVVLASLNLEFVGTAFLKHYPTTQFLNTYPVGKYTKGIHPPYYQTINVFRKAVSAAKSKVVVLPPRAKVVAEPAVPQVKAKVNKGRR